MTPERYSVLRNGTLLVCRTDSFKSGSLSVLTALPITAEHACLAPLMLSVLRRGTQKYPTLASLNLRLDYLYGTELSLRCSYRGDRIVIGFSADLLDESYLQDSRESLLDGVLDVFEELLFYPLLDSDGLFAERYVESEKELQCDAIRSLKSTPNQYASEQCRNLMYAGEPCGSPLYGTEEQVKAVTRETLTAYWKKWVGSFCPDCFYVGSADPDVLRTSLERLLSNVGTSVFPRPTWMDTVRKDVTQIRRTGETLPVTQGHLMIGLRCGIGFTDPLYYAVAVYNELLGCSPISRLFMNVREKLSLCYSCSSSYNASKGGLLISCGLAVENRERAETEIFRQLEELRNGRFSDEELNAAVRSAVNACRQLRDSPSAIESFYYGRELAGCNDDLAHCVRCLGSVTREEIVRVANQIRTDTVWFLEGTLPGEEADDDEDI